MKVKSLLPLAVSAVIFVACQKRKLTEVVEVPLPAAEEKLTIGHPDDVTANAGAFELYKLPLAYDALAPHIDAMTMEMHYSRHYLTYTNNLNSLLAGTPQENLPIEDIFKKLDMGNAELRNNPGGYYNHTLFWELLTPKESKINDTLSAAITADFGSFDKFREEFSQAASKQFGSGWAWLVVNKSGKLQITATPNQDNPLMPQAVVPGKPILALDVWEHAYYLGYQYRRKKYIDAFFEVVDWAKVSEKYDEAIKKPTPVRF